MERLKQERGLPQQICVDNGSELISAEFYDWCECHGMRWFIQLGKPQQIGFVERFNGSMCREFIDVYLFESLSQVLDMACVWMLDYNDERPHESFGRFTARVYRAKVESSDLKMSP